MFPVEDMKTDDYNEHATLVIIKQDLAIISRDFRNWNEAGHGVPIVILNLNTFEVIKKIDLEESTLKQLDNINI